MIEYIKGELTELTPALATVEAAGVGYGLNISLNTFSAIQGKKEVKLYVHEAIREDAYVLYGFVNKKGQMVIEPRFDNVEAFCNGLAKIELDGKFGYVNKKGNIVFLK